MKNLAVNALLYVWTNTSTDEYKFIVREITTCIPEDVYSEYIDRVILDTTYQHRYPLY